MMARKQKTHRGAAKRFRKSGSGFKHRRAFRSHLLTGMRARHKRRLRALGAVHAVDRARLRNLIGGL